VRKTAFDLNRRFSRRLSGGVFVSANLPHPTILHSPFSILNLF
jgi:hypothetical protein